MTSQKEKISEKQAQNRLAEVGRILYSAIKRLKDRESSKNSLYQLDYTTAASLHSVDPNSNKRVIRYE